MYAYSEQQICISITISLLSFREMTLFFRISMQATKNFLRTIFNAKDNEFSAVYPKKEAS